MPFNHYAKIKRILADQPDGWYVKRIDQSTVAMNFAGEKVHYDHYYRIYTANGQPIKYCKFQKIDKLAQILNIQVEALLIITN